MNERIKSLVYEAEKYALNKANDHDGDEDYENTFEDDFQEKFAELIVRECMKVADEGMAQVTMKVEWPSYHIKKHFGVEEK